MKLQNLAIIFIIIFIPIIVIFSLYLNLEAETIQRQSDYDSKLIQATKEAVEAFEINTVEWNNEYSTLANSKRQDLMASINVFTTSMANKLGISGMSKEGILTYVPAIVYTMYDGYYIYSPTHVPQTITDDNGKQCFYYENASENTKVAISATQNIEGTTVAGEPMYVYDENKGGVATGNYNEVPFTTNIDNAEKTYKHVLKTFVPYTTNYELGGKNYVINYTLDNYVRIYGEDEAREGYIIEGFDDNTIDITEKSVSGIVFNHTSIGEERLTENIPVKNEAGIIEVKSYPYIYNSNNDKRYYDNEGNFFTVNKKYKKVDLPYTTVGTAVAEYKKVLICTDTTKGEYIELYQLLNGSDTTWYYKDSDNRYIPYFNQPSISIFKGNDCSAINYYVETYCFNKWLTGFLDEDEIQDIIDGKKQAIINNINNNLNLSTSNYSANSGINYKLPELTDEDWEQALSNISMITFLQGQKIGLKTYNNYVVVTSTENNECVREDSLYYIGAGGDIYYHRYCCSKGAPYGHHEAYRNTEFNVQIYYNEDGDIKYYYKHDYSSEGMYQCFDCIVNRNNYNKEIRENEIGFYNRTLYTDLARERYIQMQRTKLTK